MTDHLDDELAAPAQAIRAREAVSDDELLAALGQAIRAGEAVPPKLAVAAKNAFAWRNIDAELAQLTFDSAVSAGIGPSAVAGTRSEAASIRALTFASSRLTIELEVTGDSLVGQVVPTQVAAIEVQARDGAGATTTSDEIGCFSISPLPGGAFRLRCQTQAGVDVLTGWITL
jgi:hypothetical protein